MSPIRLLMLAMLPAALCAAAPGLAQAGPTEESLRAADQEQRRLVKEGDAVGLEKILHPNMVINGPDGRAVTREMFLKSTRTGAISKQDFERVPEAVRITGTIGVLGPARMDYPQAMAAVAVVSRRLSQRLTEG